MRFILGQCLILALIACSCAQFPRVSADATAVSGANAMEYVRDQVAFGPRPPGSPALQKCRKYISGKMHGWGYQIDADAFDAVTPYGSKKMVNLIAHKGAGSDRVVAFATHYDTKYMGNKDFVGANDPGSSVALALEMARVLAPRKDGLDYWFVFLDGEEAFIEWSTFDSTYGSRHLALRWKQDGTASKIKALILLDMIGDRDLDVFKETNSTPWLMNLFWETARKVELSSILSKIESGVQDDHIPFLDVGIPSVDIIDLNYGPDNSYHHTLQDSVDKISPDSMEKVGKVVLAMLPELRKQLGAK
jgi:glutaminyl-peptide cyclotransferase